MTINWTILIIVGIVIFVLLILLNISNRNDRKKLEDKLNNDYPKPKQSEGTTEEEGGEGIVTK